MKRLMLAITVLVLSTAVTAYAQQPATPADTPRPPGEMHAMRGGPAGGGMPMMDACRAMMAGQSMPGGGGGEMMMGGPMMGGMMNGGMMSGGDPKMMGHMLEMRGEIMKAVGDIMLRHGQKMQQETPPATK